MTEGVRPRYGGEGWGRHEQARIGGPGRQQVTPGTTPRPQALEREKSSEPSGSGLVAAGSFQEKERCRVLHGRGHSGMSRPLVGRRIGARSHEVQVLRIGDSTLRGRSLTSDCCSPGQLVGGVPKRFTSVVTGLRLVVRVGQLGWSPGSSVLSACSSGSRIARR